MGEVNRRTDGGMAWTEGCMESVFPHVVIKASASNKAIVVNVLSVYQSYREKLVDARAILWKERLKYLVRKGDLVFTAYGNEDKIE